MDRQESSKEVLVKRDRLPAWVLNQLGKAKVPRASWSLTGCRLANNRSFTDLILKNTLVGWGSKNSSRLDPVSRQIHFCGRQKATDIALDLDAATSKCLCNFTAVETSSDPPISQTDPVGVTFSPTGRDNSQPHSCAAASVIVHVRRLLNQRQEKKIQNRQDWHNRCSDVWGIDPSPPGYGTDSHRDSGVSGSLPGRHVQGAGSFRTMSL